MNDERTYTLAEIEAALKPSGSVWKRNDGQTYTLNEIETAIVRGGPYLAGCSVREQIVNELVNLKSKSKLPDYVYDLADAMEYQARYGSLTADAEEALDAFYQKAKAK